MINRDPTARLGGGISDGEEIKKHSFFSDISWERLSKKLIPPPFKPTVVCFPLFFSFFLYYFILNFFFLLKKNRKNSENRTFFFLLIFSNFKKKWWFFFFQRENRTFFFLCKKNQKEKNLRFTRFLRFFNNYFFKINCFLTFFDFFSSLSFLFFLLFHCYCYSFWFLFFFKTYFLDLNFLLLFSSHYICDNRNYSCSGMQVNSSIRFRMSTNWLTRLRFLISLLLNHFVIFLIWIDIWSWTSYSQRIP